MSDISAQPIPDFGQLLSSYGQNQANIGLTQAQTGLAGANTGLVQANTGLVGLQAQRQALEIQMIKDAMAVQPADNTKNEESGVDPTEAGIASSLNKKFFVDPQGPAQLQRYLQNPQLAAVFPQVVQRADEMRKIAVEAQTARNQNEANDVFQTASTLAQNGTDHPLQSLLSLRPGSYLSNVGRAIASNPNISNDDKDTMAKNAIDAAAKYSHQYTNRELETVGDEKRDKVTGFPVAGVPKVGLTAEQQVDFGKWTKTPMIVTIDNRDTTVTPAQLGIHSPQDLINNKSIKFSIPPPGTPNAQNPNIIAATAATAPSNKGGANIPGLNPDQSDFVKSQPDVPRPPKGNQKLNPADVQVSAADIEQRKALAKESGLNAQKAQDTLTDAKRISAVLQNNPTLGPGSSEWSKVQTFMNQWLHTPVGETDSYQILSKYLNADQMNTLLGKFHKEGAQVRLGAYESRLIMEQLAANPNMTKEAITQMLKWQTSDAQYELQKARTASALVASPSKSVANFDTNYADKFPRQDTVNTVKDNPFRQNLPNFSAVRGRTYSQADINEAARYYKIPPEAFAQQLQRAGVIIGQ